MEVTMRNATAKHLRKAVMFGIMFATVLGFVGPKAQSQTAYQRAQQQRVREAEQREAEEQREEQQQERQSEAQRQQPQQQPQQYSPGTANSVPRSYVPAAAPSPARVYAPHSASTSSPAGAGNGSTTTYSPSTNGTTVYTPHGASAGAPASSYSGPTTANGRTVYTPHALVAAGYCNPGDGLGNTCRGNGQTLTPGMTSGSGRNSAVLNGSNLSSTGSPATVSVADSDSSFGATPANPALRDAAQDNASLTPANQNVDPQSAASVPGNVNADSSASSSPSIAATEQTDAGPSDQQLSATDTVLSLIETSAQQIGSGIDDLKNSGAATSLLNFFSTEVEPSLSGAITDIGGVVISLEKGLLDPGVAAGVKALVDQANDPNKLPNTVEGSQMCAIFPEDCQPAPAKK